MQCSIAIAFVPEHLYTHKKKVMQQKVLKIILLQLRIAGGLLVLALAAALLLSFTTKKVFADVWQQLGISKEKGMKNIEETFMSGWFHYYGAEKAKSILSGDRTAIAKDLMAYAKQQISSEAFKKQYDLQRKNAKPVEYITKTKTKEEIRKEKIEETEKSIKETEANLKTMKPEMVKALQPVLDMLKNNLKDYKDPNSKMIDLFYESEKMNAESNARSYEESVKNWENEYPADYKDLVKRRLQKFVDLAKTVDFSAELKVVNGRKKFVNPTYEAKAYDWKQIFRAGKEVIEPATTFAEQWIKELN
jgi:hypothetical protein